MIEELERDDSGRLISPRFEFDEVPRYTEQELALIHDYQEAQKIRFDIECDRCGGVYVGKVKTTKRHTISSKCPFCGYTEKVLFRGDGDE